MVLRRVAFARVSLSPAVSEAQERAPEPSEPTAELRERVPPFGDMALVRELRIVLGRGLVHERKLPEQQERVISVTRAGELHFVGPARTVAVDQRIPGRVERRGKLPALDPLCEAREVVELAGIEQAARREHVDALL